MPQALDKSFEATVQRSSAKGGWSYVIWADSAGFFNTRGLVKVRATVDGVPFESAFMALGGGRHKLPLRSSLLEAVGKQEGDSVVIELRERLDQGDGRVATEEELVMNSSADITAITALLQRVNRAYRERDPDAAVAADAPDATIFDLAPPLRQVRSRDNVAAWLETWKGPVEQEFRNLQVHAEGDIAFVHGFVKVSATTIDGQNAKWWMRYTAGLRRENGNWKIVHEHTSVPFYMDGSFRAALDLEP